METSSTPSSRAGSVDRIVGNPPPQNPEITNATNVTIAAQPAIKHPQEKILKELDNRISATKCSELIAKIALVVGVVLLLIGGLALIGALLPNVTGLAVIAHALSVLSAAIGTTPLNIAIFTLALGGASAIGGAFGWGWNSYQAEHAGVVYNNLEQTYPTPPSVEPSAPPPPGDNDLS